MSSLRRLMLLAVISGALPNVADAAKSGRQRKVAPAVRAGGAFAGIGGMALIKQELADHLDLAIRRQASHEVRKALARGFLIGGRSGRGKTLLLKSINSAAIPGFVKLLRHSSTIDT